jgi:hypothetical protein
MSAFHGIVCDGCRNLGLDAPYSRRLHLIRAELRQQGWSCARDGGRDLCPKCLAQEPKRRGAKYRRGAMP